MPKQERTTQMHISRLVADDWNALPAKQQAEWYRRAEMAKIQHERTFPGYRYIPRKRGPTVRKVCAGRFPTKSSLFYVLILSSDQRRSQGQE